jgi:uncharacterized protein YkwD/uncharacterized membrane protein required for colicin V production
MSLNLIDLLLVLLVCLQVLQGWRHGFVLGLFDLARWAGSLLIGLRYYQPVAQLMGRWSNWPEEWNRPLAFLLTVLAAGVAIYAVEHQILKRLPRGLHQRRVNRLFGVLPGLVTGLILAAIVAPLLLALPLPEGLRASSRESELANRLALLSDRLEAALSPILEDARRTLTLRTIPPESERRVELPFTVTNPKPRPDLEARMLELVNTERRAAGLGPVNPDPELTEVARQHSADMFARSYFSHLTPEGRTPFDRMRAANVRYLIAGENLALAPTLLIAHRGLMNSPGHRANILRSSFGRLGIGILDGGRYGLMVTQNFRN